MILDLFYQTVCPFCGKKIPKKRYETAGYCEECKYNGCVIKGHDSFPSDALPYVLSLFCPFVYAGEVKNAIVRYKFGDESWLSVPLANAIYSYLEKFGGLENAELITYVPISSERFKQRGYDQSLLIAREIARKSGLPVVKLISRNNNSNGEETHSDANKADVTSKMNLTKRLSSSRFAPDEYADPSEVKGKRILLIDDILTTGSTINECASILLDMGAFSVDCAVIASGRRDVRNIGVYEREDA